MSRTAIHPGQVLKDELAELNISATEFARRIDVPHNRISQILHGKRRITAETAVKLGLAFGMAPAFWMNLQSLHDFRRAEKPG